MSDRKEDTPHKGSKKVEHDRRGLALAALEDEIARSSGFRGAISEEERHLSAALDWALVMGTEDAP